MVGCGVDRVGGGCVVQFMAIVLCVTCKQKPGPLVGQTGGILSGHGGQEIRCMFCINVCQD